MARDPKLRRPLRPDRLALSAMGMEAEFALVVDDVPRRPEEFFRTPRDFIRGNLMHRQGTSYHLPSGAAVYFDTGVIEVATPVIEIERGCAARASRSIWEAIHVLRSELDGWEARTRHRTRLIGFSTHYNVSFDREGGGAAGPRTIDKLAWLLAHVLPVPVMLLATNRASTGVGVRPRRDRIEITADFTPSPPLMIATATLVVAVVREVMRWPSYEMSELERRDIPVIADFAPMPHTSRKGWLAALGCYRENPFACDVNAPVWQTRSHGTMSLRAIAAHIASKFHHSIAALGDPLTSRLIASVVRGHAPSLLDLEERPPEYEDVGRLCAWDRSSPHAALSRSRYERVLMRAIARHNLRLDGATLVPVGMRGWSAVVFRGPDGSRRVISIDALLPHLDTW